MPHLLLLFLLACLLCACESTTEDRFSLATALADSPGIAGKSDYLDSPFTTAGDRLYVVGHQDGSFPDLGWHVAGEMGGVWAHPIKLLDGYAGTIQINNTNYPLERANQFINYPYASQHHYGTVAPGLAVARWQFVPDGRAGLLVEYQFQNTTSIDQAITFQFTADVDLRPVWLGERTGMIDSTDQWRYAETAQLLEAKDLGNNWYVSIGAATTVSQGIAADTTGTLTFQLTVPAQGMLSLPIAIAGSTESQSDASELVRSSLSEASQLVASKAARFKKIQDQSALDIPDTTLAQAYRWVKYNTEWLVQEVPGVGRGLTAGIPDYPWWFGADTEYALQGALATGRFELAYATIELIHQISDTLNGNGRIIHEVSTNGAVFNPGNINETPQFASLIWTLYAWTGRQDLLEKYYPSVRKGLDWLLTEMDQDGNGVADGFGMMEIHGLDSEMIDVATYTQQALSDAARMATALGREAEAARYQARADQLATTINTDFWVPAFASYADFIGTTTQANHLIEDAIVRADTLGKPWAVTELKRTQQQIAAYPPSEKRGFVVHHNWVVNTPIETGVADSAKAIAALNTGSRFVNPFGVFVTGIDRDESAGSDDGSFAADKTIFSYVGAVMTLPTGVQAVAENNYGRPDQALDYLQRMTRSFSYAFPGSIYEVSPDFGMITQAWTIYSYAVPIVQQFFGIQPQAYNKTVVLQPQFPSDWDKGALHHVRVGTNQISIQFERLAGGISLKIDQTQPDWQLLVQFPQAQFSKVLVNDRPQALRSVRGMDQIALSGLSNVLVWTAD